ncbi:MAG: GNAT family N-acetyltransferase [Erysipelotrichaceae bacterium]|jgi:predicted acetyltransferase
MLKIIEADPKYLPQYEQAYIESIKQIELGNIKKHDMMFLNPKEKDVVKIFAEKRDQSKLPEHYVPSYNLFAVDGDRFIGVINIRVRLTDNLLRYGGHIGYAVHPKYWRMGYGKKLLKLGLGYARKIIQEDKILLTCDDDNVGSCKIIEANKGILEDKVENLEDGELFITRRYWIEK